ncbi:MAG: adenylosuccinate lyase [Deinococcales bacterium]
MIERYSTPEMRRLWSDASRYRAWLRVELAATEAWESLGEVPEGTAAGIAAAIEAQPLDEAFAARVAEIEASTRHDIVAFTRAVGERAGDAVRYLHLGLTSTDVVDTAQNLLLREACDVILADVAALADALRRKAVRFKHTPCVGRTHGIHAEPMTFGLKFLNFLAALRRDEARLRRGREQVAVAMVSGSVGTYAHVPPEIEGGVAERLGLTPDVISNQTVARDRHAELMSALAILGTTIERIALEVRHLQRTEVRELQEGFGVGQTGSSSMPHKKNPIASENLTGIARLLRGNLQAELESVALWHERDISHSSVERVVLPDSTTLASYALRRLTRVLDELVVDERRMAGNLDLLGGLVFSQRVLHLLIDKGLSREAAYEIVQRHSLRSWETGEHLRALLAEDPANPLDADELAGAFDPAWYLRFVDAVFARFGL